MSWPLLSLQTSNFFIIFVMETLFCLFPSADIGDAGAREEPNRANGRREAGIDCCLWYSVSTMVYWSKPS